MKLSWPETHVDYLEWLGTITGLAGALIISSNIGYVGEGYMLFIVSALSILYVALKLERWGLFTMSLGYAIINAWGVWRWLILPLI
ncbi:hypothetical protein LCGC14_1139470 [marine sediment metagenome]|uniref:Nicotinamide riboside transporter PnuC n=1 Tax=marine sediment metagenome TaxID=412755 RepID=A0A0F9PGU0_9ZZZZ